MLHVNLLPSYHALNVMEGPIFSADSLAQILGRLHEEVTVWAVHEDLFQIL